MPNELTMPQMGFDMREGTVVRWLKSVGEPVDIGEAIAEIETDKAVVEFESFAKGTLSKILIGEGSTVPVGEPIALFVDETEHDLVPDTEESSDATSYESSTPIPLQAPENLVHIDDIKSVDGTISISQPRVFATPIAKRMADEENIDIASIVATGVGGRVVKEDVMRHLEHSPNDISKVTYPSNIDASVDNLEDENTSISNKNNGSDEEIPNSNSQSTSLTDEEIIPLSRMRQQIARVTTQSKSEKPHFYVTTDIDMSQAISVRLQINNSLMETDIRVTVNDLVIKACVLALKKYPKFNSFYTENGIKTNQLINIGIAIAHDEGLIVPAVLDSGNKTLKELAIATKDLADRTAKGTLSNREYAGGTFAISNLGMFGVSSFVAIIQPPQTAVLAVGAVSKRPVVGENDTIKVSEIMTATISGDHRIVDGAEGAHFINEIKRLLENPMVMLI